MSWNTSIQINKLYQAYLLLSTTALTNPMIANLNMASYNINNVNTINAITGTTLTLNADSAQGITVSTKMTIPNHPLIITNNTADDSLQVGDNIGDTSIFRVDHNGNVAVKSNPATVLSDAFNVLGDSVLTGNLSVSGTISGGGVPLKSVRNTSVQSYSYSSSPLVLSYSTPARNVFTIPLNASFNGCNVFTFYIRTLTITSTTNTGTNLQFRFYPSRTSTNQLSTLEGAMYYKIYDVPSSSTTSLSPNIIWNWVPSGGLISNTLYMNIDASLLLPNEISVSNVDFVFDIVGSFTTLV